jgi:hypothetical protein
MILPGLFCLGLVQLLFWFYRYLFDNLALDLLQYR